MIGIRFRKPIAALRACAGQKTANCALTECPGISWATIEVDGQRSGFLLQLKNIDRFLTAFNRSSEDLLTHAPAQGRPG